MNATFGTSRQAGRLGLRTPVGHHACPHTMRVRPPTLPNWKNVAIQHQPPLGTDAFKLMAFNRPSAQQGPSWNPVEVVKREQGLQSNKLPTAVRESVESAIEQLRFRVTVGDVAARAGVKLRDADEALKALAYDSQATLEVSEQGDVVYTFARNFRSSISSRSLWLSAQPALRGLLKAGQYLVRVAFGTALVSSIAIVWFAIVVLLSSKGDRDERRDRGGGGYYNGYSSYNGGGLGPRLYFNLTDLLIYLDPNYASTSHERIARGNNLTFLEAIFSFVFGDGDPNAEFDAQRWAALGQLIQDRGGVVTAEEMAPFLDPPPIGNEGRYTEESFVLPALIRFGGEAEVDESTGMLLYRFPQFQASGVTQEWVRGRDGRPYPAPQAPAMARGPVEVPQERTWELTAASMGQVLGVVALGVFNVAGVVTLSGLLADPQARYALTYQGLGWITNLMPALQIYAAAFFGIPAIRTLFNLPTNSAIAQRNGARQQAANLLNSGKRWLSEKLGAARREGVNRTVRKSDVVFTTEKDATPQLNAAAENEWDKKFLSNSPRREPIRETAPWGQREPESDSRPVQRARDFDGRWK